MVAFSALPPAASLIKDGLLRALAVTSDKRAASLPDVPTMREQGYDAEFYIWCALFAPAGISPEISGKLRSVSRQIAQDPDFKKAMDGMNTPIDYRDGADFQSFLDADGKRLAQTIRRMGKTQ